MDSEKPVAPDDPSGPSDSSPASPSPHVVPEATSSAKKSDADAASGLGAWASVGFDFGVGVLVFFFLGSWLDATWGTSPWMRVAGAGLGVVLGMYLLILKAVRSESSDSKRERPPDRMPPSGGHQGRTPPGG